MKSQDHGECLWFHTVSAGEAKAAIPIIENVLQTRTAEQVLVTTTTPTGYDTLAKHFGDLVRLCYVPYDIPSCVNRFLKRSRPKVLFLMETELWPNLVNQTAAAGIPVYLLNARLSEKSKIGYSRLGGLTKIMLRNIRSIACQYQDTADRFQSLGLSQDRIEVTGNVKFDLVNLDAVHMNVPHSISDLQSAGVLIWLAGSTHSPEEHVVLSAHKLVLQEIPDAILILAPRHPSRTKDILSDCNALKLRSCTLSQHDVQARVIVVDQMGILFPLYQCATIAFVGGSLQQTGGHNPIEPAVHGLPILMGPNRHNFAEVCSRFTDRKCLFTVHNASDIAAQVLYFHRDVKARTECSERARAVVRENRGALNHVSALIDCWLRQPTV